MHTKLRVGAEGWCSTRRCGEDEVRGRLVDDDGDIRYIIGYREDRSEDRFDISCGSLKPPSQDSYACVPTTFQGEAARGDARYQDNAALEPNSPMPSGDQWTCASLKIARHHSLLRRHCGRLSRHSNLTNATPAPDGTSADHQVHAPPGSWVAGHDACAGI